MARVTYVASSRKSPGECGSCGKKIGKGQPYKWAKPQFGAKMVRCDACSFKPSDLSSSKMGTIWDAQEQFSLDGCKTLDEMRERCSEFAETVREVGAEYEESAGNIEDGFGHRTAQCDELEEKAQELESWADECESAADSVDEFDEESAKSEAKEEVQVGDDIDELVESKKQSWLDEAVSTVESVIQECPV